MWHGSGWVRQYQPWAEEIVHTRWLSGGSRRLVRAAEKACGGVPAHSGSERSYAAVGRGYNGSKERRSGGNLIDAAQGQGAGPRQHREFPERLAYRLTAPTYFISTFVSQFACVPLRSALVLPPVTFGPLRWHSSRAYHSRATRSHRVCLIIRVTLLRVKTPSWVLAVPGEESGTRSRCRFGMFGRTSTA
jgi:hypothetical protein